MNIIEKRIDELIPYEKNPRRNNDAVKYVAASIKNFGFRVPIVIDKDNVIVCGHTRLKAAKQLKMKTVPCVVADDLTDEQIKAFRLADNRVSEFSEWDDELLPFELSDLKTIDMSEFGFEIVTGDEFGEDFELPNGEKSEFCHMKIVLHKKQKDLIMQACKMVKDEISETFGNPNENGNAIFEVCRQWVERKKFKLK